MGQLLEVVLSYCSNVLRDELRICCNESPYIDFAVTLSCRMQHGHPLLAYCKQAGTVMYIAPEVLRNKYTLSADLWSVGIVAYLLLAGRLPFSGEEGEEVSDLFMRKQTFQNRVRCCRNPPTLSAPCIELRSRTSRLL